MYVCKETTNSLWSFLYKIEQKVQVIDSKKYDSNQSKFHKKTSLCLLYISLLESYIIFERKVRQFRPQLKGQKHKSLNDWETKSALIQFQASLTHWLGRQQSIHTYDVKIELREGVKNEINK